MHRRISKYIIILFTTPLILFVLLSILIYIPAVQRAIVDRATAYASDELNMTVSIENARLSFPLNLTLQNVKTLQVNDSISNKNDTIANIKELVANVELLPLLKGRINIETFDLRNAIINTTHFIKDLRVKGDIGQLSIKSKGIDLKNEVAIVNNAFLRDAKIDIALSDTAKKDTASSEVYWKINLRHLRISSTYLHLTLPDNTKINTTLNKLTATNGVLDLRNNAYRLQALQVNGDYENFKNLAINIDSLLYNKDLIKIPIVTINTQASALKARLYLPASVLDSLHHGDMDLSLKGYIGKEDFIPFIKNKEITQAISNAPVNIDMKINGDLSKILSAYLQLRQNKIIDLSFDARLWQVLDDKRRVAMVKINSTLQDLSLAKVFIDKSQRNDIHIPGNIIVNGNINARGSFYDTKLAITNNGGKALLKGSYNTLTEFYDITLNTDKFPINNFYSGISLKPLTSYITLKGKGTDILSKSTNIIGKIDVKTAGVSGYDITNISSDINIKKGIIDLLVNTDNDFVKGSFELKGITNGKLLDAQLITKLQNVDLKRLNISEEEISFGILSNLSLTSNLNNQHTVKGNIGSLNILDNGKLYQPKDIEIDISLLKDTTYAKISCGDFKLKLESKGGYENITKKISSLAAEINKQIEARKINVASIREHLPQGSIYIRSGKENIVTGILAKYGYKIDSADLNFHSSPTEGINGQGLLTKLDIDSTLIDTLRLKFNSDDSNIRYRLQVRNGKKNPQYVFNAIFNGAINESGAFLNTRLYDKADVLGIDIGIEADWMPAGISLSLLGSTIIGYKSFEVNDSNYIFIENDRRVHANVKMRSSDNSNITIITNEENTDVLQDITFSFNKFSLDRLFALLPFAPNLLGTLNGDFHLIQSKEEMSVAALISVDDLVYEGSPMGNISTEFVYMPKSGSVHFIDGILSRNDSEVGHISGTYSSINNGELTATMKLERMPMLLINGMIPDRIIGFNGYAEGEVTISGNPSKPTVNGEVYLDSCHLYSEPYGINLRFANDPVRIINSRLQFDNFEVFAANASPLNLQGEFDFSNLDKMKMDVRMRANNFKVIEAKENLRSEVFGNVFVNFFGRMAGDLGALKLGGKVDVLSSTDMTYILRDSPLTTTNQAEGLVEYVSFTDSIEKKVEKPIFEGLSIDLTMSINEGAHVLCALNADKSNYIDIMGGGDLRLRYGAMDGIRLTGRYTLNNGDMKYSMPVIPLKTFTIKSGSYIEWTGDAMNPRLSITATESTKASVSSESDNSSRTVDFDCGVVITKTLKSMGLEFIINAPNDMTVSNQLNTMGNEERGKVAVTMLTTGMYLTNGNTSGFSMNNALNAFLQSQINGIAGNALRTLDLSIGMDNVTSSTGNTYTDYSFKFAKRFWNNRLRVIVGGKVSSGNDASTPTKNDNFVDNVSLEYRLNQNSTRYLQLFYIRDSYDWLEGNLSKYGAGFIWRKKMRHFKDLLKKN